MAEELKIIVGLGNPGERYQNTRHNAGYHVVAKMAEMKNFPDPSRFAKNLISKGKIEGQRTILAWPQTFMNNSGQAVRELLDFYKVKPSCLLVVHDDMDLPVGRLKAVNGGGSSGHNGLTSLIGEIRENFDRLRVGIGRPVKGTFDGDYAPYVLSDFEPEEREIIDAAILIGAQATALWSHKGLPACQRKANVKPKKAKKEKAEVIEGANEEKGEEKSEAERPTAS
ncbi:MAG: aminoacyl-tRNA hydrolase [Deltaproteobacteria bacterium]|nr:aminoacyl-tRNA hydrolase [Deltaproteobacteria bacterium]